MPTSMSAPSLFCDQCGAPADGADHDTCRARRAYEPPRYCALCGRRMVVQVTPAGWTARCGRHGDISASLGTG